MKIKGLRSKWYLKHLAPAFFVDVSLGHRQVLANALHTAPGVNAVKAAKKSKENSTRNGNDNSFEARIAVVIAMIVTVVIIVMLVIHDSK